MKTPKYDINFYKKKLIECQSQQSATLETITPAVAARYLASNYIDKENRIKNRDLDDKTIAKYMNDIKNGRWEVAEPILFDNQNRLIDGQGRCTAVIKSQTPIISWVIRGLSPNAFAVIDCGKKRSLKDSLTTLMIENSEGHSLSLSSPARVGTAINIMHNMNNNSPNIEKDRYLTTPEITEMVRNDFDFYEEPFQFGGKSKIKFWQKRIKYSIPASYFAAFYYMYKRTYGDTTDEFLNVLTSNDDTTPVIVRKFRDDVLQNKNRNSFDRKYLKANAIMKRIEVLFSYYQQGTLNRKKEFTKKDLE